VLLRPTYWLRVSCVVENRLPQCSRASWFICRPSRIPRESSVVILCGLTALYWARVTERRTIVSFCAVERKHLSCPVSARTRKYDQCPARGLFPTRRNIRLRGARTNLPKRTLAEEYGERNNYAKIKGCLVSHVPGSRRVFTTILARGGF
jgi:hypothetical protein